MLQHCLASRKLKFYKFDWKSLSRLVEYRSFTMNCEFHVIFTSETSLKLDLQALLCVTDLITQFNELLDYLSDFAKKKPTLRSAFKLLD